MNSMTHAKYIYEDAEDPILYFETHFERMLKMTAEIDDLYWEIEKEGLSSATVKAASELIDELTDVLVRFYMIESDIIYKALKEVLPEPSSINAIKYENDNILEMCNSLKSMLEDRTALEKNRDFFQAELISLVDLIQRNVHKKESIIMHELRMFLDDEELTAIKEKVKKELDRLKFISEGEK